MKLHIKSLLEARRNGVSLASKGVFTYPPSATMCSESLPPEQKAVCSNQTGRTNFIGFTGQEQAADPLPEVSIPPITAHLLRMDRERLNAMARERYHARRAEWFAKNGPCKCGSWDRLEVDHIEPETKITHCVWAWSKVRREAELAKCQPLCWLCHLYKSADQTIARNHVIRRRNALVEHIGIKLAFYRYALEGRLFGSPHPSTFVFCYPAEPDHTVHGYYTKPAAIPAQVGASA